MGAIIGQFSLISAIILLLIIIFFPILGIFGATKYYQKKILLFIDLQFYCFSLAFFSLIYSFVISDFSLNLVVLHSHILKPLLYKITGSWGNHEGSMLLFGWELSLITFIFAKLSNFQQKIKIKILIIQAYIILGLALFIIFTSNPFLQLLHKATEGLGLNPLLQDVGLASHPPALYLGYVSASIGFSTSVVCLLEQNFSIRSVRALRPWVLISWSFLTLGILLGSWWAYRELGWGGFWFWDPVENASLMPWLTTTALIHILFANQQLMLLKWSLFLAQMCFSLCILGTFLVRSSLLTSVHSFVNDPVRGIYILGFLLILTGGGFIIFILKSSNIYSKKLKQSAIQFNLILLNSIILFCATLTVLLGTIYPLLYQFLTNRSLTIGSTYFVSSLLPLMLPNFLFSGLVVEKQLSIQLIKLLRIIIQIVITIIIVIIINIKLQFNSFLYLIILGFSFFSLINLTSYLAIKIELFEFNLNLSYRKISQLPLKFYGMFLAHLAISILAVVITILSNNEIIKELNLQINDQLTIANYQLQLKKIEYDHGPNYLIRRAFFTISKNNKELKILTPEIRFYPIEQSNTTESSIYYNLAGDLYIAIGEFDESTQSIITRIYYKPLMSWIWISGTIMVIGGLINVYYHFKRSKQDG